MIKFANPIGVYKYILFLIFFVVWIFLYYKFVYKKFNVLYKSKRFFLNLFFILFFFLLPLTIWIAGFRFTGDEPYYLLATHSLFYDHDLDLTNNFEKADHVGFYKHYMKPHLKLYFPDGTEKYYLVHRPLLSMVCIPFYLICNKYGPPVFLCIMTILYYLIIFKCLLELDFNPDLIWPVFNIFILTMPFIQYNGRIYGDNLLGLSVVLSIYYIIKFYKDLSFKYIIAASLAGSTAFFINLKSVLIQFAICSVLVLSFFTSKRNKKIVIYLLLMIIFLILSLCLNYYTYGVFFDSQIRDELSKRAATHEIGLRFLYRSFFNFFIDVERGIIIYNPLYLLLPSGLLFFLKNRITLNRMLFICPGIIIVLFYSLHTTHSLGQCIPGRLILSSNFSFIFLLLVLFSQKPEMLKDVLTKIIIILSFMISFISVLFPPLFIDNYNGILNIFERIPFLPKIINNIFVVLQDNREVLLFKLIVWVLLIIAIQIYFIKKILKKT